MHKMTLLMILAFFALVLSISKLESRKLICLGCKHAVRVNVSLNEPTQHQIHMQFSCKFYCDLYNIYIIKLSYGAISPGAISLVQIQPDKK